MSKALACVVERTAFSQVSDCITLDADVFRPLLKDPYESVVAWVCVDSKDYWVAKLSFCEVFAKVLPFHVLF